MSGFWRYSFRRSTLWLLLFVSFLCGLGLAKAGYDFGLLPVLITSVFLVFGLRKRSWLSLVLVIILGVFVGMWRGGTYMQKLAVYDSLYEQKVTLIVTAGEDATYNKYQQLSFTANNLRLESGERLTGKIQLSGFGANAIFQGDELIVTGKLMPGYSAYQGRMSFAVIQVVEHHPTLIGEIRSRFVAGAQTALPDPLAPFVMGLLVGQRATLPEETKNDLRTVGLTHIIAVSGYNLTIILQASRKIFGKKSKRIATWLSIALIGVFLLLAGASASIVRAAIVSMLSIVAGYYGRAFHPLNLITFAACITAYANPVYLWSDLSWYLSFLAFYGVMVLSPLIQARWKAKWHQSVLGGVALESICAEIITLPFVLHTFGQMSRVGLIANVLVVSLIPLAMLLGVFAGLAGMFLAPLAGWITWPCVLLLNYMLDVAHILANLPHVFVEGIGLSLGQMLLCYGCIAWLTAVLWYKTKGKSAIITDIDKSNVRGLMA